jgi:hypothetical protein
MVDDVVDPGVLVEVDVLPTVVDVVEPPWSSTLVEVLPPGVEVEVTVPLPPGAEVEVDPSSSGVVATLEDDDDDELSSAVLLVLSLEPVLAQATPTRSSAAAIAVTIPMIRLIDTSDVSWCQLSEIPVQEGLRTLSRRGQLTW